MSAAWPTCGWAALFCALLEALLSQELVESVDPFLLHHGAELGVAPLTRREAWTVLFTQGADEGVASLMPDLTVPIPHAIVETLGIVLSHLTLQLFANAGANQGEGRPRAGNASDIPPDDEGSQRTLALWRDVRKQWGPHRAVVQDATAGEDDAASLVAVASLVSF